MKGKLKNCVLGFLSGILAIMGGVSVFTASASGNETEVGASYAVDVQDASASIDPSSVIGSVSGASVTSNYKKYKISDPSQVNYSGLAITSENKEWQGKLGGVYYGDLELEFRFMGESSSEVPALKYGDGVGEFTFKIIDATNPDKYFWVSYRRVTVNGNGHVTVGVKEGGSRPTDTEDMFTAHLFGYINATPAGNGHPANGHFFPAFHSDRIETENAVNVLSFKNTTVEGKMSVASSMGEGCCKSKLHSIRDIGKFDGETKAPQSKLPPLSKLYFPSGYRVEFSTVNATEICFISIKGKVSNQGEGETVTYPQGKALGSSVRLDKNGWRFGLALSKTEYASLTSTYGNSYDIGFAVTKNGTTKYKSVKDGVTWADITIDGQEYKYAVFTITDVPTDAFKTEISYYGYFKLDEKIVSITETVVRTFDNAIRTAYERGDASAKDSIVKVYGNAYREN